MSARAHSWLLLATRVSWPLGTCHRVPSTSRTRVERRVTCSTVPLALPPRSTTSPTPNWSSATMKKPAMKSRTIVWVPKPRAMPAMPAPAIRGPKLIPSTSRIQTRATNQMKALASDRNTAVRVWTRASVRRFHSSVRSRALGVRLRIRARRSWWFGSVMRCIVRLMSQRASRLARKAVRRITRIASGLAIIQSARPAQVLEPVQSKIHRQAQDLSSPHASSRLERLLIASAAGFWIVVEVDWAISTEIMIGSHSSPDADRGPRRGPDQRSAAGSGAQVLVHEVPVDEVVEDDVEELRPRVAVVDVVGVLPHVDGEQRLLTVLEGQVGVGRLGHLELAAVVDQPGPAGAELGDAGLGDLGAELVVGAEVGVDAGGD